MYYFKWWGLGWYSKGVGWYRFFFEDLSEGGVYDWSLGVGFFEIRKRQKPRHTPLPYTHPKKEKPMIFDGGEIVPIELEAPLDPVTTPHAPPDALRLEADRIRKGEASRLAEREEQTALEEKVEGYKLLFRAAPHDLYCASVLLPGRHCNCWKSRA